MNPQLLSLLSRPHKVLFPEPGLTKADLADYYVRMSPCLLPFLRDRPLVFKQYPDGVEGRFFFRQTAPRHAPPWIDRFRAYAAGVRHEVDFLLANDERALVWVANQAAIELHAWLARKNHPDEPDLIVFDLDPGADLDLRAVREVALLVRDRLARDRIESVAKLSGKRGIHLLVPLAPGQPFEASHAYAQRVARDLEAEHPKLVTATYHRRAARRDRVLVDYAQNARGKATVAPYSVRPTPNATVSMPLPWSDFERGVPTPNDYTLLTVPGLVEQSGDVLLPALARAQRLPG